MDIFINFDKLSEISTCKDCSAQHDVTKVLNTKFQYFMAFDYYVMRGIEGFHAIKINPLYKEIKKNG